MIWFWVVLVWVLICGLLLLWRVERQRRRCAQAFLYIWYKGSTATGSVNISQEALRDALLSSDWDGDSIAEPIETGG